MPNVIIIRTNEFVNRLRDYQLYIDGKNIGKIGNGQTKEFSIPAGKHKLIARIDWCSSQEIEFEVQETQTRTFNVGSFKNGKWIMPISLITLVSLYVFNRYFENKLLIFSIFVIVPLFGVLFYYITIGRKKYLTLSETISADKKATANKCLL